MTRSTVSYEVVTAAGAPIRTFEDRKRAMAWIADNGEIYPGVGLERVTRSEVRVSLSTARLQMVGAR